LRIGWFNLIRYFVVSAGSIVDLTCVWLRIFISVATMKNKLLIFPLQEYSVLVITTRYRICVTYERVQDRTKFLLVKFSIVLRLSQPISSYDSLMSPWDNLIDEWSLNLDVRTTSAYLFNYGSSMNFCYLICIIVPSNWLIIG